MDSAATRPYEVDLPQARRLALLTPYDLAIKIDDPEGFTIELGRFSLGCLSRIRFFGAKEPGTLLRIGSFCEIGTEALILIGGEHDNASLLNYSFGGFAAEFRQFMDTDQGAGMLPAIPSEIGNNVIISARATVLPGAKIEAGTVIGAGAIAKRAESYGIYAGVPARRIRDRFAPDRLALYQQIRLPDVSACDVPKIPGLVRRLEAGEIGLEDYLAAISFLPARPTVHSLATFGSEGEIVAGRITGYSLGGEAIGEPHAAKLNAYFGQIGGTGKVQWVADIFESLGLYG